MLLLLGGSSGGFVVVIVVHSLISALLLLLLRSLLSLLDATLLARGWLGVASCADILAVLLLFSLLLIAYSAPPSTQQVLREPPVPFVVWLRKGSIKGILFSPLSLCLSFAGDSTGTSFASISPLYLENPVPTSSFSSSS